MRIHALFSFGIGEHRHFYCSGNNKNRVFPTTGRTESMRKEGGELQNSGEIKTETKRKMKKNLPSPSLLRDKDGG